MSTTDPSTQSPATHLADPCCPVVEVRQYTLYPGQRDVLITLFDRALVESQEACGMRIIGQFRDRDRPNRFVWLRGFGDMSSRAEALQRFYSGPVWAAHRDEANATMVDFSDVLLLRPARPTSGFVLDAYRAPPDSLDSGPGLVVATIYSVAAPGGADFLTFCCGSCELSGSVNDTSLRLHPGIDRDHCATDARCRPSSRATKAIVSWTCRSQ